LNLNFTSNRFEKNSSHKGGSLFIREGKNVNSVNNTSYFLHNVFYNNSVHDFGGAIYYEFENLKFSSMESRNNSITLNTAEINGGGIYAHNPSYEKKVIDISQSQIRNNYVDSYENNYSSRPFYISLNEAINNDSLNITSGDYLPLRFSLLDKYNNVIVDIPKYYSSIMLKITLIEKKNENDEEYDEKYNDEYDDEYEDKYNTINEENSQTKEVKLMNNLCSFSNGI